MGFDLEICALRKSFGALRVIEQLSLQLRRQQIVALVGPSGCGKSTLFNLISGLDRDFCGQIFLHGEALQPQKRPLGHSRVQRGRPSAPAKMVGYMLQKDLLLPWRNIESNVFLPQEIAQRNRQLQTRGRDEIEQLFALFGLEDFRRAYPRQLSGGMRQRVNLLRTYTLQTDLLLLDEPFGALDALTKKSLHYWFLDMHRQQPRSILLVTHDIHEAILLADQVLVLGPRPSRILGSFVVSAEAKHGRQAEELEEEIFLRLQSDL